MMFQESELQKDSEKVHADNNTSDKSKLPETETEPKSCDKETLDTSKPDNGNIQQNQNDMDTTIDKAEIHDNLQNGNIAKETNKKDVDNETLEHLEQNPNVTILGVANIDEKQLQ